MPAPRREARYRQLQTVRRGIAITPRLAHSHDAHRGVSTGESHHPVSRHLRDAKRALWGRTPLWAWGTLITWSTLALSAFDPTGWAGDGPEQPHVPPALGAHNTARLASANVTSLQGVWDLIVDMPFDVLALQEMHIHDLGLWQRQAQQAGMHLVVPDVAVGSEHLVGFLVRKGTLQTIPFHSHLDCN